MVTSVVGAFYYLRLVKVMYFDEPVAAYEPMPPGARIVLALASLVVVLLGIVPGPIVGAAGAAVLALLVLVLVAPRRFPVLAEHESAPPAPKPAGD